MEEIRPDMLTVRNACKNLRTSERFKAVLQVSEMELVRVDFSSFIGGPCCRERAEWLQFPWRSARFPARSIG